MKPAALSSASNITTNTRGDIHLNARCFFDQPYQIADSRLEFRRGQRNTLGVPTDVAASAYNPLCQAGKNPAGTEKGPYITYNPLGLRQDHTFGQRF